MTLYYCKHCENTIQRDSTKQWMLSWCVEAGKEVRIYKVKPTKRKKK